MVLKIRMLFVALLCIFAEETIAQEFTYKTFDGEKRTIYEWPVFLITSQSQEDLSETLRCASLLGSLESPVWLINFAWPGSERAKRIAANAFLKSEYMKSHSTILKNASPKLPLISLVDSQFRILWCSSSYPVAKDWNHAVQIFNSAREL